MDLREEKIEDLKHLDIHCFKRDLTPDTFVSLLDYHDVIFCIGISISVSTHALDLGQRTIRADGKIVNELKIKKQADTVLRFLKGTDTNAVMESGLPISIRSSKKQRLQCKGSTSTHG